MDTLSYKTISVNSETAQKEWVEIDATGQTLGRLCFKSSQAAERKMQSQLHPAR